MADSMPEPEYEDYNQNEEDITLDGCQDPFASRAAKRRINRRSHRHLPSRFPPPSNGTVSPNSIPTINSALGLDSDGNGTMSLNAGNGQFPSFLENPSGNPPGMGPMQQQRQAPSPSMSQTQGLNNATNGVGVNGMGMGMAMGMPVMAGQQMDVNMVYQRLLDLSEVLRENRERTQGIVAGAEELAVCSGDGFLRFFMVLLGSFCLKSALVVVLLQLFRFRRSDGLIALLLVRVQNFLAHGAVYHCSINAVSSSLDTQP